MDLNEFMAEDEEMATTEVESDSTATMGIIELPMNVDFKLTTQFDNVIYEDLVISKAKGDIQLKEGVAATHVTGACVENKQNIDKARVHSAQHKACM